MKFVVFDVTADLAQFKKPFTTMSPQTFGFPTGTALVGMIAAIVGLDKKKYWSHFPENDYRIAVGLVKGYPLKKVVVPINTLKTTSPSHFYRFVEHKRTTMEFVKDACYRIWFAWQDTEQFNMLRQNLSNHASYYTLSLGLAWNLADFKYIGFYEGIEKSSPDVYSNIHSVIDKSIVLEIDFTNRKIFSNRIPVRMKTDNSRQVEQYGEYLFESEGYPIRAKVNKYVEMENGDCVVPL